MAADPRTVTVLALALIAAVVLTGPGASDSSSSTRAPRHALLVAGTAAAAPPGVNAPLPQEPAPLARTLAQTTVELERAIRGWVPKSAAAPDPVVLQALYQQRIYR